MRQIQQFNDETEACILEIETNYPELYNVLEETPFRGISSSEPISAEDLEDYLNTLKEQLHTFQKK
ncbi:hypothetical protein [Algibacter sp. L1A34]|uniref:hypothetical protein n=1 Tax=Algibacter sp. L1A34 TaxID=2686365 RepID=UPI00131C7330|nr:hypothetical protein [Algibacter sp. L1A34]